MIFSRNDLVLEAGGFQPVEAYDVIVANLDPQLRRHDPPENPLEALKLYPGGLSTQEVAAIMTAGNDAPDRSETERRLIRLQGERHVERIAMGNDAIWLARD